jgi:predicted amidohydrolase
MKIGVVQHEIRLGDVELNLNRSEVGVREACKRGAGLVLLPEFFNSGIAYDCKMLSVPNHQTSTISWMRNLASELGVPIGGSLLTFDGTDAHNTFVLMFPEGELHTHRKDIPTMLENAYYVGGDDDGVLETSIGCIGVALCWEMIRWRTVVRMAERVDFVLASSCWWGKCPTGLSDEIHLKNVEMLRNAPRDLARLVGAPVAHASSVGTFSASRLSSPQTRVTRCFLGHSQIVAADGDPIVRARPEMSASVLVAELPAGTHVVTPYPRSTQFWIPELTEAHLRRWNTDRELGRRYYDTVALSHYIDGN